MQDLLLTKTLSPDDLHLSEATYFPGEDPEPIEVLPNVFWDRNGLHWRQPLSRIRVSPKNQADSHVQKIAFRHLKYQLDMDSKNFDRLGLTENDESVELYKAFLIAMSIHHLQLDPSGQNHIRHLERLFNAFREGGDRSEFRTCELQALILKDVIRDSKTFFYRDLQPDDLTNWGFGDETVEIVGCLAPLDDAWEPNVDAVLGNPAAVRIKRAELEDYLLPTFLSGISPAAREKWKSRKLDLWQSLSEWRELHFPWEYVALHSDQPRRLIDFRNSNDARGLLGQLTGLYNSLSTLERWQEKQIWLGNTNLENAAEDDHMFRDNGIDEVDFLSPREKYLLKVFLVTLMREIYGNQFPEVENSHHFLIFQENQDTQSVLLNKDLHEKDLQKHVRRALLNWRQLTSFVEITKGELDDEMRNVQLATPLLAQYSIDELVAMYVIPESQLCFESFGGLFKEIIGELDKRISMPEESTSQNGTVTDRPVAVVEIRPEDLVGDGLNRELGSTIRQEILRQWPEEE